MDQFKSLQWNIRSIKSNKTFLEILVFTNKIQCAFIAETSETFKITGYRVVRADRTDGYGGSCLLIKNDINYQIIDCHSFCTENIQISAAKIQIQQKEFTLISIYCKPKHNTNKTFWNKLISHFTSLVIIGGDFNAHRSSWGSSTSDREGKEILEFLSDSSLTILNDGSPTLFSCPGNRVSAVDLTFCTPKLAPSIKWSTFNNTIKPLSLCHRV